MKAIEKKLLEIKLKKILFPTLDFSQQIGLDIGEWENVLRAALTTSLLLNKNVLTFDPRFTFLALALSVELGTPLSEVISSTKQLNYFNQIITDKLSSKDVLTEL